MDLTEMEGVQEVQKEVLIGREEGAPTFVMRRFEVGDEGQTPYHNHDWEHEVYVLSGKGKVKTEEGPQEVEAGDAVYVPPNENHQFVAVEPPLRFICLVPNRGELD